MWIPGHGQKKQNQDKNDPNLGELLIPYDFEVYHTAKVYRLLSKCRSCMQSVL